MSDSRQFLAYRLQSALNRGKYLDVSNYHENGTGAREIAGPPPGSKRVIYPNGLTSNNQSSYQLALQHLNHVPQIQPRAASPRRVVSQRPVSPVRIVSPRPVSPRRVVSTRPGVWFRK